MCALVVMLLGQFTSTKLPSMVTVVLWAAAAFCALLTWSMWIDLAGINFSFAMCVVAMNACTIVSVCFGCACVCLWV